MDDLTRKYYGKNYDKAMKTAKQVKIRMKNDFLKKYPNADLSKFDFEVYLNQNGTLDSTNIFFKNSDVLSTDITSSTFLNDKTMTKYLFSNVRHSNFPTIIKTKSVVIEENNKFPKI